MSLSNDSQGFSLSNDSQGFSLSNDSQGFSLSNDSQGFSLAKTHFDLIGFFINGTVNENLNRNLSVYINFLNQSFKEESRKQLLTELTKQDEKPILNQKQQYSKKPINQIPVLQMPTFDFQSNIRVVPQVYS